MTNTFLLRTRSTIYFALLLANILPHTYSFLYSQTCETRWIIKCGNKPGQIVGTEGFDYYDFEVYRDELFLCDIINSQIKRFDKNGTWKRDYPLPHQPEIMTQRHNKLFVLLTDGSLVKFDLTKENPPPINIRLNIDSNSTSRAFFQDSILIVPSTNELYSVESDGIVINLDSLSKMTVVPKMYSLHQIYYPSTDSSSYNQFRQHDLCGCSGQGMIVSRELDPRSDSGPFGYTYYSRSNKKGVPITCPNENSTGLILHSFICRGFKIYPDAIYCIGIKYKKSRDDRLIVTKIIP